MLLAITVSTSSDEIVTQVVAVRNVSAAQLVPILRPLIPQYGHLAGSTSRMTPGYGMMGGMMGNRFGFNQGATPEASAEMPVSPDQAVERRLDFHAR